MKAILTNVVRATINQAATLLKNDPWNNNLHIIF